MKNYLLYPLDYKEDVAEEIDNGCGTEGWKGKLIPDTIYGVSISEACRIHDYGYHFGKTMADKEQADSDFLFNIRRTIIHETRWTKFLNWNRRKRAYIYYLAVAKLGKEAFLEGKDGVKKIEVKK